VCKVSSFCLLWLIRPAVTTTDKDDNSIVERASPRRQASKSTSTTSPTSEQVHVDNSTVKRASQRRQRHRQAGESTSTTPSTSEQVRDLRPTTTTSTTRQASGWRRHRGPRGPWSVDRVVCSLCYLSTPPSLHNDTASSPSTSAFSADVITSSSSFHHHLGRQFWPSPWWFNESTADLGCCWKSLASVVQFCDWNCDVEVLIVVLCSRNRRSFARLNV